MKKLILSISILCSFSFVYSQNINDQKVNFNYVQLPYFKIDPKFDNYEVKVVHEYLKANEDSTAIYQMRKDAALSSFMTLSQQYAAQRDSLDKGYLRSLSTWEKSVNAGVKNPDGSSLPKPAPPMYPEPPMYPTIEAPILHTALNDVEVNQGVKVQGYTEGLGGFVITVKVNPIQHLPIKQTVKGTGAAMKYEYSAPYLLPIDIKVESPTQGVIFEEKILQGVNYYNMASQQSQYDHQLYMMDNKVKLYTEVEAFARRKAINSLSDYLNGQIGYVVKQRVAELYSVKNHKNYDYSDVTDAFNKTVIALQLISNDNDRSGAIDKIDEALQAHQNVLEESNLSDNKARVNDKITAMLQCNVAELLIWKAEFDKADGIVNIAMNSGEGKAKRHLQDELGFYADQRKRWDANY